MTYQDLSKTDADTLATEGQATPIRYYRPRYSIDETDAAYLAQVDLPGVGKEDLEISLEGGTLEVIGRRSSMPSGDWKAIGAGASEGDIAYRLRLSLGDEVNGEGISAQLENGALQVTFPKAEEKKPRKIAVN